MHHTAAIKRMGTPVVSRNNPGTKRWPKHSTSKRNNSFTQIQLNINRLALSLLTVFLASGVPASADLTAFIGVNTTPSNRQVRGFGAGLSLLMLGLEFEYSDTALKDTSGQRLQTGMANLLAQTPFVIKSRLQFYGTIGAGLYRERVGILQVTNRRQTQEVESRLPSPALSVFASITERSDF